MRIEQAWIRPTTMVLAVLGAALALHAQAPESVSSAPALERTLSPYFLVKGGADRPEAFPLESTTVDARVSGVIAEVTVRQRYLNAGHDPIEAVYVFPASTRAAVHGLRLTIGERVIEAVVKEREEARRTYQEAKEQGKSASLLEQHRPNVFQMNVANILPGDRIDVELRYAELLVPEEGVYELVYPTVVGPRYSNRPAESASAEHRFVANPYLRKGEPSPSRFGIGVTVQGGLPVKDVGSPSHAVKVAYSGPTTATVGLEAQEADPGNRDFILRYRLQDTQIQTGLLLDGTGDERFFLLMLQPPQRISPAEVPPREYVFVIDVSGSMNGFPLDVSKGLMRGLLHGLRPQDRFNVVLFAGSSALMAPRSLPATAENVGAAMKVIDSQKGGGGTELLRALDTALALPEAGCARSIVILTDGYVDVESEAFDRIRDHASRASVFAFGIGSSVNRFLIEGLAHVGQGEPFIVTSPEAAGPAVERFQRYVASPLLTEVEIDWGQLAAYDVEPPSIPILMGERPLVVCGKWRGSAAGHITVRGRRGPEEWSTVVPVTPPASPNPALRYLWARERLRLLSDFAGLGDTPALREQIVSLGLRYNLLTRHTSFVAVDQVVRNLSGTPQTVLQPLPLPQGVPESAVGMGAPTTPEPGTLLLLGVAGGAAARYWRKRSRRT
jgi:Ca-activated chloride channel homolog